MTVTFVTNRMKINFGNTGELVTFIIKGFDRIYGIGAGIGNNEAARTPTSEASFIN